MSTPAIGALRPAAPTGPTSPAGDATTTPGASTSFADTLKQLVDGAETNATHANAAVTGMLDKSVDVHDAMIALQRAEMSLQLAVQIRNKLVQAYQDIMRMPV
jgi:flagellar hook-basal body complex protein FliE